MKKLVAILCVLAMLLPTMLGCSKEENPTEATTEPITHTLRVGYSKVDITPTTPMPIGDPYFGAPKMSSEIANAFYVTCVAFSDETDNTVLLFHLDVGSVQSYHLMAKATIAKKLGIPGNQIMVTATHTHASPRLDESYEVVVDWMKKVKDSMVQAAEEAMADRKAAQMYTTSIQTENMNFIRHYVMSDGSYAGDNFGDTKGKTYVSHTEDPDRTLSLIKFTREGGKDVILANWQGHPHRLHGGSGTVLGSDIVGVMREKVEQDLDCNFAYFSGASGNINNAGRMPGETITKNYLEHGNALADYAVEAAKNFTQQEVGKVQILEKNVVATAKDGNNTLDVRIYAFSLGDVGFITAPYEMFNSQGMEIKEKSPFNFTFVCTYANGHMGYIVDLNTYNSYKCYEETQTKFQKGTAEQLTAEHIAMLNQIYETRK